MRNIPNILTSIRIMLSFMMLALVIHQDVLLPPSFHRSYVNYFSCLIFCVASITDFFDGYIARVFNTKSKFGEIFDPLADKMLILGGFIALLVLERINPWAAFLILSREFFITGLRVVVATKGHSVASSNLGKYKTGFQIAAIAFLLADFFPGGNALLWMAVFVTIYSGFDYVRNYYVA